MTTNPGSRSRSKPGAASAREVELLEAIRRIIHGYDLHSRRLLATSEVTLAQLLCLTALAELGPRTARQLADGIHIGASTMVGILDRLEGKRLITRKRDGEDRRRVFVTITPAGRAVLRQSPPPLGERLRDGFGRLGPEEQASLAAALRRVADLVEPEPRGAG